MKSIRLLTIVLFITLGLSGCSTIIDKTYKPEQLGDDQKALLAKPVELDQVLVERIKNDGSRKIEDVITDQYPDYRVLGSSGFRITSVSDQEIKRQAVTVGASLVAVFHGWVGTEQTGVIANTVPLGVGGAFAIATPIRSNVNEYQAIFLAKYAGKKERIGINAVNLPAEVQQKLERNKGVLITNVDRGPAFDANMLIGDVVIAINGAQVIDDASAGILIRETCRKGSPFVVTVIRGTEGKQRDISILNCI